MENMNCSDASQIPDIKKKADDFEKRMRALNQKTESLKQQRDSVLEQYEEASADAHSRFAPLKIFKVRQEIRHDKADEIKDKLYDYYGIDYSLYVLSQSLQQTRELLGEEEEERRLARELREREKEQRKQEAPQKNNRKRDDWER